MAHNVLDFLTDTPWIITHWLEEEGFSNGLRLSCSTDYAERIVNQVIAEARVSIEALGDRPTDKLLAEQYDTNSVLIYKITGAAARIVANMNPTTNAIHMMSEYGSGAKGAAFNVAQIMGLVGQQYMRNNRLQPAADTKRCIPAYDEEDKTIEAYGFCKNSFMTGLTPE